MPNYTGNWMPSGTAAPGSYLNGSPSYTPLPNYTQMPQVPLQYPQSQGGSGIVYIDGIEAANEYPVAAGGSVLLMDGNLNRFYIKSNDSMGINKQLRVFDYKEVGAIQNESKTKGSSLEIDSLKSEIKELRDLINLMIEENGGSHAK